MRILIYPNRDRDRGLTCTREAARILSGEGAQLFVQKRFIGDDAPIQDAVLAENDVPLKEFDMVLALGGDGTILGIAHKAAAAGVPVAGVNLGNLGYMTTLEKNEMDKLKQLVSGDYYTEKRMMLKYRVRRGGKKAAWGIALNDTVLKGELQKIISLSVFSRGRQIYSFSGDGIIVASPTGTTAYTLSAGGPVVEPEAEAIAITPICAHNLFVRSFVVSGKSQVTIRIDRINEDAAKLTVDGQDVFRLQVGDEVDCSRAKEVMRLVSLHNDGFFDILRKKLSGEAGGIG